MTTNKKAWQEDIKNERADLLAKAVADFGNSEAYKEYLKFIGTFHDYSLYNTILIHLQGGRMVKGFNSWKADGRSVKKGEKAIKIYAPMMGVAYVEQTDTDGNPILDKDGNPVKVRRQYIKGFRRVNVFDVSQTEGKDIPEIEAPKMLTGYMSEDQFSELFTSISNVTDAPVRMEAIDEERGNGYFVPSEHRIAIREGMSNEQTIKTLIHEVTHSLLHNETELQKASIDRATMEVEAESVAYLVCSYLGIESSDYSFGYVSSWAKGDVKKVLGSMDKIKRTADLIIGKFEAEQRVA